MVQLIRVIVSRFNSEEISPLQTKLFHQRKSADACRNFRRECVYSWSSFHCAVNAPKYTRKHNGGHRSLSVCLKATTSPLNRRQYKIKVIIKTSLHFTYLNEAIFDLSNGRLKFDFVECFKKARVTSAGAYWKPKTKSPFFFLFRLSPESSSIAITNLLLLLLWCLFYL